MRVSWRSSCEYRSSNILPRSATERMRRWLFSRRDFLAGFTGPFVNRYLIRIYLAALRPQMMRGSMMQIAMSRRI